MQPPGMTNPSPRGYFRGGGHQGGFQPRGGAGGWFNPRHQMMPQNVTYDGKRMRKAVYRKTVDYNCSVVNYLENRVWQRDFRDQRALATDSLYASQLVPPPSLSSSPMNCVTTKFIRTSTNKIRCPIFCVCWTPEGRRLITGASSGEFTLWNGLTFNFETILQAHDSSVRSMIWSHNDLWMLTADHAGFIKYWQSNMNNVKMYQAHKDPIRGLSFCPTDHKFASCSDDGTVRVWDFLRCHEEKILRGHGADVKCVDWHPQKSLLASGSKDTQQPVKLWDPRTAKSLATIHAHKHTVMEVKWNRNGNWLLTASRDHLLKLFDIRRMKEELQTFKGHKKEATTVAWHPIHESLFASGGSDGAIMFWLTGHDKEVGSIDEAHETMVWSLAWHPLGHILASGSNDHSTKFWTRNRVGDKMRDKYNLNTLPLGVSDDMEYDNDYMMPNIPGMGLEYGLPEHLMPPAEVPKEPVVGIIPGLGMDPADANAERPVPKKKVPYAKPIPRNFEKAWESGVQPTNLKPSGTEIKLETEPQGQRSSGQRSWSQHRPAGPGMRAPGQPMGFRHQGPSLMGPPAAKSQGQIGGAPTGSPRFRAQQGQFSQPPPGGAPRMTGSSLPRPPFPGQEQYGQRATTPQQYGQPGHHPGQGQGQGQGQANMEQSVEQGLKELRAGVSTGSQWGQQQQSSFNRNYADQGQAYRGGTNNGNNSQNGEYSSYGNARGGYQGRGGLSQGSSTEDFGAGRGRGRGRGGPYGSQPPFPGGQAGSAQAAHPPSLLDLPLQKRPWDKGPGDAGNNWGQTEGMAGRPAKFGRADGGEGPEDSYRVHSGMQAMRGRGGPLMRGGGPPMRGGSPFRGRGGPPMRGRGGPGW